MDGDTLFKITVVQKDSEDNEVTKTLDQYMTLEQLSDWILASFDGKTEPTWAV